MAEAANRQDRIPLFRPRLPDRRRLAPYLDEIDRNRWYTNFGPLARRFEARLAERFGLDHGGVVTTANGTAALTAGLLALGVERGRRCVMPSWSHAATPLAALAAGLTPYFADVDPTSWALEPGTARDLIDEAATGDAAIGAVVPVAPFGRPIDSASWDAFSDDTGIAVIIDGAAAFDALSVPGILNTGATPIAVSLHATKAFGVGEGGLLACGDARFCRRARAITNFGMSCERQAAVVGLNGKLSEYAAAVGLAGLDGWDAERGLWRALAERYRQSIADTPDLALAPGFADGWVAPYCNVVVRAEVGAPAVIAGLAADGIEARQWWGAGCHGQPAFADCPRTALGHTEDLAARVVGLPCWVDLEAAAVERVVASLSRILAA